MFTTLIWFSSIAFFLFGTSCLVSSRMRKEFERYRLAGYRTVTGILQIMGATGLLTGLVFPAAGMLASGGLALQMLLGFGVRMKIRDGFILSSPAFIFMVVNSWLCFQFYRALG